MNLSICFILVAVATLGIEACHHRKQQYPPDTFPEGNTRRRRGAGEVIYTIYPTTRPSVPDVVDVDTDVSNFFTKCLQEKTGRVFRSWKSVVDFVLRDMRWYSSTEEQYCPENTDRDPRSTICWQNRLNSLFKSTSRILPKAKECVQEYIWSKQAESQTPQRRKRQITSAVTSISQMLEVCLGVRIARFDGCIRSGLITSANLRQYPSLRSWDAVSVDQFILEHVSDCRITSRYANGRNNYNQVCPRVAPASKPCLSTMYNELVRTSAPLFSVQKSCTNSLRGSQDKCRNVQCYGNHATCNKNTGLCECDSGYVKNARGICEIENKCALVYCGARHETCNQNTGLCECVSGYSRDSAGVCKSVNKCTFVVCLDRNAVCDPRTGQCICPTGYSKVDGYCVRDREPADPCKVKWCRPDQRCVPFGGVGYCVCRFGLPFVSGLCAGGDACTNVDCGANAECTITNGRPVCRCNAGYERRDNACRRKNDCAAVRCQQNMECRAGIASYPVCVCEVGFVRNLHGLGCVRSDPCAAVTCPTNSNCVNGKCECAAGFELSNGFCIRRNLCANIRCEQNMDCQDGRCVCRDGFTPSPDIRPGCVAPVSCAAVLCPVNTDCINGNCVCRDGFEWSDGFCIRKNLCDVVQCSSNMRCENGKCVCRGGFVPAPNNQPGCVIPDPCANVQCPTNSDCVSGTCQCKDGFELFNGICRRRNPCIGVQCASNMRCENGNCVCQDGFVPAPINQPGCVPPDPCAAVQCPTNSDCINGNCVCKDGFEWSMGICTRKDPCDGVQCASNMRCEDGNCVCQDGFVPALNNQPGCVVPDPCAAVQCPTNSDCVIGNCVCKDGFEWSMGNCIIIDPCTGVTCQQNMKCDNGNCVCEVGFVSATNGQGCETPPPDPCDGVSCPPNSQCVLGSCTCDTGFEKRGDICLRPTSCSGISCGENQRCVNGKCECVPGFVPVPEGVECIPDQGTWMEWGAWRTCSLSCGAGEQVRVRQCDGNNCVGDPLESRKCNTMACVGTWMEWGQWLQCTITCGGGEQARVRQCEGDNCVGDPVESRRCNTEECEDTWMEWGSWGTCSLSCGGGEQVRSRQCDGSNCVGDPSESRECNTMACVGTWTEWEQWLPCARTCGGGDQVRFRECDGVDCVGDTLESRRCNTKQCEGTWMEWGSWGRCSATCGGGLQTRVRRCDGSNCVGDSVERGRCNTMTCVDDQCVSVTCPGELVCSLGNCACPSGSRRTPQDTCVQCPPGKEYRSCAPACYDRCDGTATPDDISACFGNCRQGVYCVCPSGQVERSSTDSTCVRRDQCPGSWNSWRSWGSCSATCGGGQQSRTRTCQGADCQGDSSETRQCNTDQCQGSGNCQSPKVFNTCPTRCPKTCQNRGIAIQCESGCRQGNVQCICPDGMIERSSTDSTCVSPNQCVATGHCLPNPCKNQGTCFSVGSMYICDCLDGYSGRHCEIGCGSLCTPNGRCVSGSCVCNSGFQSNGNGGCTRN